jgi:hypothetical protein
VLLTRKKKRQLCAISERGGRLSVQGCKYKTRKV